MNWILNLLNLLGYGWTWTEFENSRLDLDCKIWQSAHLWRVLAT